MPASQVVRALAALPCWWTLSLLFSSCAAQIRAARGNSFEELMTATLGLASTVKALRNAYGPHIIEANCPAEQLISGFAAEDGTEAKSRANKLLDDLRNDLHAFEGDEMRTWMRMAWILNPATLEGAWKDTARVERPQRPPMRERIAAALKTVGVMAEKGQDDNEFCIFAAWSIARALMTKAGPSPQTYDDDNAFASWGGDHPGQGPRIGHLDSLGGVVREMSAVYREVRLGKTEPDIGCKLVYILKEIRAALEAHVLERLELRLEAIEGGRHGDEPRRAIPPPH